MACAVAYLEMWKEGAAKLFDDLFLGRRPTSTNARRKTF
jgi:hypothetical protein